MPTFHRRSFLKGLSLGAGAVVLGPILRQLEAYAAGEAPPRRIVILMEGDCLKTSRIMPPETLAAIEALRRAEGFTREVEPSHKHYTHGQPLITEGLTLPPAIEPLSPYLDRLNMVFGLSSKVAGSGHCGNYGTLSSAYGTRTIPGGQTIDHLLGERLGADRVFPRLALGTKEFPTTSEGEIRWSDLAYGSSASERGKPEPIYVNPTTTYRALFGSVAGPQGQAQFGLRSDLLDALADDTRRVRDRLSGQEHERLDAYLGSLETLRDRQSKIVGMAAALEQGRPELADTYASPHLLVRLEAQVDLAAAALVTGLTPVVLLTSACSDMQFSVRYTSIDPEIPAKHHFGHSGGYLGQNKDHWLGEVHRRHTLCLVRLIEKLQAVPEGDGSAWDNTLLVYMPDGGEDHHASFDEFPTILLSGVNVPLRTATGGRSVVYPGLGSDGHRQMSNLFNTFCHAMGVPEDDFGAEGSVRVAPGPLTELLT